MASPAACGWCGKSANLDLVYRVCWFGLRQQITQAFKGTFASPENRGCPVSSQGWSRAFGWGEKWTKWQDRGASVQGKRARRSPRVNFSVSVVCTMKAPLWLNVDIQNGGPDLSDKISEAKMLHKEDMRAFALREREFLNLSFFRFLSCLVCGFCFMFFSVFV